MYNTYGINPIPESFHGLFIMDTEIIQNLILHEISALHPLINTLTIVRFLEYWGLDGHHRLDYLN